MPGSSIAEIEEVFKRFLRREDIAIILINQNVSTPLTITSSVSSLMSPILSCQCDVIDSLHTFIM